MVKRAATNGRKKGLWTVEEDRILMDCIIVHGHGKWNHIAKVTGLKRSGKSCRFRWNNHLNPDVKRDSFSPEEDDLIIRLHKLLGNRWALIAGRIPGRTDNQVKNYWNTHLCKKIRADKGKSKAIKENSTSLHQRISDDSNISSVSVANKPSPNSKENDALEITTSEGIPIPEIWDDTSFWFLDDYFPNHFFQLRPSDSLDFLV